MRGLKESLRVTLIAGQLAGGGAEKQMWYMAGALYHAGVDVRIYNPSDGRFYGPLSREPESALTGWGQAGSPAIRLAYMTAELRRIRPHIVQAGNFWTNLYAGAAGRLCGAVTIGAMRNDLSYELNDNGRWGRPLLRACGAIIANASVAIDGARDAGIPSGRLHLLPNVIDLKDFDAQRAGADAVRRGAPPVVMAVGRLVPAKRFDRFLNMLAVARRDLPALRGLIVGDGPERQRLEQQAEALGLLPNALEFLGARKDVPALLRQADMLALTSDHEGFPNVVLEAMAAKLPVVATPAGDAEHIVVDSVTGYIVPFEGAEALVGRIVQLAGSHSLRVRMGEAARSRVEERYSYDRLAANLFRIYRDIAQYQERYRLLSILEQHVRQSHGIRFNCSVSTGMP